MQNDENFRSMRMQLYCIANKMKRMLNTGIKKKQDALYSLFSHLKRNIFFLVEFTPFLLQHKKEITNRLSFFASFYKKNRFVHTKLSRKLSKPFQREK